MPVQPPRIDLCEQEIEFIAIRAQGAGGQNVNKVSNAIHLRFDIGASSLPGEIKVQLLKLRDQRVSSDGIVVIKAQQYRSLERNRMDAITRLRELIARAAFVPAERHPTRPTRSSQKRRLDQKLKRGLVKMRRGPVNESGV